MMLLNIGFILCNSLFKLNCISAVSSNAVPSSLVMEVKEENKELQKQRYSCTISNHAMSDVRMGEIYLKPIGHQVRIVPFNC